MLYLDLYIPVANLYTIQNDFYLKFCSYFFGIIVFFEMLRNQISEISLYQLIPGFYLFLFLIFFVFLLYFSEIFLRLPFEIDSLKDRGTKTISKLEILIFFKFGFFLLSTLLFFCLQTIIPLSLESFNDSGEKTLENAWSFSEVILLEVILLLILIVISQIPLFFSLNFETQKTSDLLSQFWKLLILILTIFAGFFTPTLDGYTQVAFATFIFSFYLLIINFLQKRILLKKNFFFSFGN
jgi:hypothetical protein